MQGSQLLLSGLQYPNRKLFISRVGSCLRFSVPESGAGKHASRMADQQESQDLPAMETTLVARLLRWLPSLVSCVTWTLTASNCLVELPKQWIASFLTALTDVVMAKTD